MEDRGIPTTGNGWEMGVLLSVYLDVRESTQMAIQG